MKTKRGCRKDFDVETNSVLRKVQRDGAAFRHWQQFYQSHHGCPAYRGVEKNIITSTGTEKMTCMFCGRFGFKSIRVENIWGETREEMYGKIPLETWHPWTCHHPDFWLTYQCVTCRYVCHKRDKAKKHESEQGHHMKLVEVNNPP